MRRKTRYIKVEEDSSPPTSQITDSWSATTVFEKFSETGYLYSSCNINSLKLPENTFGYLQSINLYREKLVTNEAESILLRGHEAEDMDIDMDIRVEGKGAHTVVPAPPKFYIPIHSQSLVSSSELLPGDSLQRFVYGKDVMQYPLQMYKY